MRNAIVSPAAPAAIGPYFQAIEVGNCPKVQRLELK